MKYQNVVYGDCRDLAIHYGEIEESSGVLKYIDPFGCDFEVYYKASRKAGERTEAIHVFFGGLEVYSLDGEGMDFEWIVDGSWKDLVPELWNHALASNRFEELYDIDAALLDRCRKEAQQNKQKLEKYRDACLYLMKNSGLPSNGHSYSFYRTIDGHTMAIHMENKQKDQLSWDQVRLRFDHVGVFGFAWNSNEAGGIFDGKGTIFSGDWEKMLLDMANHH